MSQCSDCGALVSDAEATEAMEIAGPGTVTMCTGCAHHYAEQEEEAEQAMILPLTNLPTGHDAFYQQLTEMPAKFTFKDESPCGPNHPDHIFQTPSGADHDVCIRCGKRRDAVFFYAMSCGVCGKPCKVPLADYVNDLTPVCNVCEQTGAELAGDCVD